MSFFYNLREKVTKQTLFIYIGVFVLCIASIIFVEHNHFLYERPIAQVADTTVIDTEPLIDGHQNEDELSTQHIEAILQNGDHKGEMIALQNEYSQSGAYDQAYSVGDNLFVILDKEQTEKSLTGSIQDVKRDTYMMYVLWVFIFTLLFIGKKQGFYSIVSLALNAVLLAYALDIYVKHPQISLLLICGITVVLFTVTSLLLVNGRNEKSYAAIIVTLLGTFSALFITWLVMLVTNENGLRYEAMDFLTRPYQLVFMAGLFVGSLGAVMDVAITMSSSIFELYEKDPHIKDAALKASALDIGKDIMGTMTSILFFAYVSGSMPMLILYLKNGTALNFALSLNLSLELARALAGGIGIVLAIPFGLYVSLFFVNRKRAKI